MRAVVQRVRRAAVTVDGTTAASIGRGLLVLLGVTHGDTPERAEFLGRKVAALRIFDDEAGKMNRDVREAGGAVLCVSQFTLYGDTRRGNRPSFSEAAPGELAEPLYVRFCEAITAAGVACERGVFGEEMLVSLENDGPVTLILDSGDRERPRSA